MGFILKCVRMEKKFVEPKKLLCVWSGEQILSDCWIINKLVSGEMQECRHILFTLFQSLHRTSRAQVLFDLSWSCSKFVQFDTGRFKGYCLGERELCQEPQYTNDFMWIFDADSFASSFEIRPNFCENYSANCLRVEICSLPSNISKWIFQLILNSKGNRTSINHYFIWWNI